MTQSIGRTYMFCAAHRIIGHEGKCRNLHGHTYTAEIVLKLKSVGADAKFDNLGRIIDYSVMDEVFGEWIKKHWDHGALLCGDDPLVAALDAEKSKVFLFGKYQPTAEVLAGRLAFHVGILLEDPRFRHVELSHVVIRESPTSFAEIS